MESAAVFICLVLLTLPSPYPAEFAEFHNGSAHDMALRLADGGNRCAGRVEIFHNGEWGTVCDDLWDMSDAEVVCRQIGCGKPVSFHTLAYFGQGKGKIMMDDVNCRGNETYLWDCGHRGLYTHNCGHAEDAGVNCTDRTSVTTGQPDQTSVTPGPPDQTSVTIGTTDQNSVTIGPPDQTSANTELPDSLVTSLYDAVWNTTYYEWNYTCGGLMNQSSGIISSPFYPRTYPPNSQCVWEIQTAPNSVVELSFNNINLEDYPNCEHDSVTIYDGHLNSSVLSKICQPDNHIYHSSSNVMTIEFRSNGYKQNIGFTAQYKTLVATNKMSDLCGSILTNINGLISSPRAVSPDMNTCIWYINVYSDYKVHLTFTHFLMKNSLSCHSFSLSVYDGPPRGSRLLGQLCENTAREFTSSSNSLSIVYSRRNDDTDSGLEFSASYNSVLNYNPNVSISCYSDYMKAQVSISYLESLGHSLDNIFLNDPQCRPHIVLGWLEFHIPYQGCQTTRQIKNDTISYENILFTYSTEPVVIHRKKLSLTLRCLMYEDTIVDTVYNADDIAESALTQYGLYSAHLNFFQSPSFLYPVEEYPYYVNLNQTLYLQATLDTSVPALVLSVDTCVASPDPFDFTRNVYYIIRDMCKTVPDYKTYHSISRNTVRFGFRAVGFLEQHSSVYIQCKLVVCKRYDIHSRCSLGCVRRHKRSPEPHHEHVHVVAGPVHLLNPK